MSKGSNRRPEQISQEELAKNWEKIFGNKQERSHKPVTVKDNKVTH